MPGPVGAWQHDVVAGEVMDRADIKLALDMVDQWEDPQADHVASTLMDCGNLIHALRNELACRDAELSKYLNTRHDGKDGLAQLYSVANMLPACELFAAVSGGIQDFQYYKEQVGVLREALAEFVGLIRYQYTGSREAMSALQEATWNADKALAATEEKK